MAQKRWHRIEDIVLRALEVSDQERGAFVESACAGDEGLRREVESLLAEASASDAFLNRPAAEVLAQKPPAEEPPGSGRPREPAAPDHDDIGGRLGHYRVLRRLGEGGMGVVYEAEDERLGRRVALKVLRTDTADPHARERLVREARVAAGVSHPLICQVFELGDWNGRPFIAMELIEGKPLAAQLAGGPLAPGAALRIAMAVAEALAALHARGIVHRDLKPSNIFLSASGVKVLDFGLAQPVGPAVDRAGTRLTLAGMFVGTPQYASPEQLTGALVDERSDIFSLGVVVFEMLAGRTPFSGATLPALAHAVMFESPPVLTGSAAATAADRILHRALAKAPAERYATAAELAHDLRGALALVDSGQTAEARPMLRLAVLPFRLLKPDPEIDYLGPSLAEALAGSLAGLESLVLRSTLKSARWAQPSVDLGALAADLAVDVVVTGTLLRLKDRVRVSAELLSVPSGDRWWSHTRDVPTDDVLELYDDLAGRIVASLPLTRRDHDRRPPARAASGRAFDLYLRGMQLRGEAGRWREAHAYFEECLAIDPSFAPAWAERGRLERVMAKYGDTALLPRAESSFLHALALNPNDGAAQYYYAQLEIDLGRLEAALTRLLERAGQGRAEPQIYAALVHACRYAGLLEESVNADRLARRLDPAVATSVLHTYYLQGDYERALTEAHRSSDPFEARVLGAMGRDAEAVAAARREEERFASVPLMRAFSRALRAAMEEHPDEVVREFEPFESSGFTDGEGLFYLAEVYARAGRAGGALALLRRAVNAGFLCAPAFASDPYLRPLHASPDWAELVEDVRTRQRAVAEAFVRGGGPSLLGRA
jgi:serine/threonine protein kinase